MDIMNCGAVAIDSTPIENQGRIIIPFTVKNRERIMEWLASPPQTVRLDQRLTISARVAWFGADLTVPQPAPGRDDRGRGREDDLRCRCTGLRSCRDPNRWNQ